MKKALCVLAILAILLGGTTPAYAANNILTVSKNNTSHSVSDSLYGIFLEDISYACDGGLVSNLVNNGSFEMEERGETGWTFSNITAVLSGSNPMSKSNPTYQSLTIDGNAEITNIGFPELYKYKTYEYNEELAGKADMGFKKGEFYRFSCYIRNVDFEGTISVCLNSKSNKYNTVQLSDNISANKWTKLTANLKSNATEDGGLTIKFEGKGTVNLDFVSLVPKNSYGFEDSQWKYVCLRSDLVDALKNLNPSFLRFPGGCLAEGTRLDNLYSWKDTIGPLEERPQSANLWSNFYNGNYYNNTSAMGYHEYFQLSEDLGAEPIPILNAGMTCQARNGYDDHVEALNKSAMTDEQWQEHLINDLGYNKNDSTGIADRTQYIDSLGINSEDDFEDYLDTIALKPGTKEFHNYAQDILDLIEYANGDSSTTYWGAKRAENGHEAPYDLKYIGIGNENWGDVYFRNFDALKQIINAKYPKITVISSAGAAAEGNYFDTAWSTINRDYPDTIVDEHYYTGDSYLMEHNNRYDNYNRNGAGVFVGEYATVSPGFGTLITKNNIYSATEEAGYMTGLERNSDIVKMASYAPTLAKINANSWDINMIWFDSQQTVLTPNYYTQMLFANNIGKEYVVTQSIGMDKVYQSVTVDSDAQIMYIKLVNCNSGRKKLTVNLEDFGNINRVSNLYISHKYKSAANQLNKQTVAPRENDLKHNDADFEITLPAYSANVIRVAYGDNTGTGIYTLPENIDYKTKSYMPVYAKVIIAVAAVFIALSGASGYLIYKKIILSRKRKDN